MTRVACGFALLAGLASAQNPDARFFNQRAGPILRARCLGCHNDELKDGDISFQDRATLLKGGSHGPAIVPAKPEKSYLIRAVKQDDEIKMPPGGKLSAAEVATLTEWIRRGAVWGIKLKE